MKRKQLILFPVILSCLSGLLYAQTPSWSGIIDSSRAVDWSNAGVRGGIPTRTTNCATFNPGATAAQINLAIAKCPSGQVVFLNPGAYNLSAGLVAKANVTLRGAGPDQTIISFSSANGCGGEFADICVGGPNLYWVGSPDILPGGSHAHNWTGGYSHGATQITVDSASGLSPGMVIILDQSNDTADNGQFLVCDVTSAPCSLEGGAPGRSIHGVTHSQEQFVTVQQIQGTTLTISPGLYASNWSGSKSPGIFWTNPITGFGVEAMTLNHTNSSSTLGGIVFTNADSCWVKNVRSIYISQPGSGGRNHVWFYLSSHITVADSYFYGTKTCKSQLWRRVLSHRR